MSATEFNSDMRTRISVLFLATLTLLACAAPTVHQPYAKDWALWSWKSSGSPWHYAFVYPADYNRPVNDYKIKHSRDVVIGETALKRRLAAFPTGTSIIWSDNPPTNTFGYPSRETREQIKKWARSHGSRVLVNPMIE